MASINYNVTQLSYYLLSWVCQVGLFHHIVAHPQVAEGGNGFQ